ncbi:hypothetical protein F4824DRAFT_500354 [Ustulina deusta]|nr:hypothetical protein F4824DRAFT_500354 [Ustulina deusta]
MAETAATIVGIAGIVGVLQNLLQCYRDFLTARDFGDDFAILQVSPVFTNELPLAAI